MSVWIAMPSTLVLFDLDGTLIDSAPDLCAAANRLRTRRGIPALAFESLREYCGSGARGMVWQSMRVAPGSSAFDALRKEFLDDYGEHMNDLCAPFAGAKEMLATLTQTGIVWGIVTNKSAVFARPICEEKGLLTDCACLVSGNDMGKMKPLPDPILEGVKQCANSFDTVIYVGDDQRDARAAQAAGVRFIAAGWGYTKAADDVSQWGADAIANEPCELIALIESLSTGKISIKP